MARYVKLSCRLHQLIKARKGIIPIIGVARLEDLLLLGSRNRPTTGGYVRQVLARDCLDQDVAQRRGLDRSGHDGPLAGISGKLAEQVILAAATDDPDGALLYSR
jgi:hypothetical protein